MSETSVTPLKQPKPVVRNDSDVKALKPRQSAFHAEVPDAKGLRLKIKPNGSKLWEVVAKGPNGQAKTRSLGSFPEVTFKHAIPKALKAFQEIKEGIDPRYRRQKIIRQSKAIDKAKQPIVELARAHVEQRIESGEVKALSAENDYRAIRQIQAVIGHCSFMNFGLNEAKVLARAYPEKTAYGARDKTQKMIAKTYRGLDQSTQREIDEDIPRLLRIAYGSLKRRTRAEQTIQTDSLADFWGSLMRTPCPNELHRDALVLALLTGERKDALLGIEIKNIHIEKYECIYVEGKTSRGTPTKNLIPLTPILGALIERMKERAIASGSQYLFPKLRLPKDGNKPMAKPHLTTINKSYIESLGLFNGVKPGAHNLRRTLANIAASILGSQDLAQEHILHFSKYTSGAKWNYFDQTSLDFLQTRRETFEKCHRKIDDLILSRLAIVPFGDTDQSGESYLAGLGLSYGSRNVQPILNQNFTLASMEEIELFESLRVVSPLALYTSNESTYVHLENRPLFAERLFEDWVSLITPTHRDFKSRIE